MKNIIFIASFFFAAVSFNSCGNSSENNVYLVTATGLQDITLNVFQDSVTGNTP